MKIESIRIQNFRSIVDELIYLDEFNALIGPNGSGKSTILSALNVFFFEDDGSIKRKGFLEAQDCSFGNTDKPIIITLTFTDLTKTEIEDFLGYYRNEKLVVQAVTKFNKADTEAEVKRYGAREVMEEFVPFFEAESNGVLVAELKEKYSEILKKYPEFDLPPLGTKAQMIANLRNFEENNKDRCVLKESEDLFHGFTRGSHILNKYIQWIHVPAVKDITEEQVENKNTALEKLTKRLVSATVNLDNAISNLLEKTTTEYLAIIDKNKKDLEEVSNKISALIKIWASPRTDIKLEWKKDDSSIRVDKPRAGITAIEQGFSGDLDKFGHGFQRSYFLALLQALAEIDDENSPKLILGCEEPELYQHPPQIRHLTETFEKLSDSSQILITTHSPLMVTGKGFETIRMVHKKGEGISKVKQTNFEKVAKEFKVLTKDKGSLPEGFKARLHQDLQSHLNEMFFSNHVTFVEGLSDFSFINTYIRLLGLWEKFREFGCHIIPVGGKRELLRPMIICKDLGVPFYAIWDSDSKGKRGEDENRALFKFYGQNKVFLDKHIVDKHFTAWEDDILEAFTDDVGKKKWDKSAKETKDTYNFIGNFSKNSIFIGYVVHDLWEKGYQSKTLIDVCKKIIDHAELFSEKDFLVTKT